MKHDLRPTLPLFGNRDLVQYDRYQCNLYSVSISKREMTDEFYHKVTSMAGLRSWA